MHLINYLLFGVPLFFSTTFLFNMEHNNKRQVGDGTQEKYVIQQVEKKQKIEKPFIVGVNSNSHSSNAIALLPLSLQEMVLQAMNNDQAVGSSLGQCEELSSYFNAVELLTTLLGKLSDAYKKQHISAYLQDTLVSSDELLKIELTHNDEANNQEFCWKNIVVLRHELYEYCKKNDCLEKEKKQLLFSTLAVVAKSCQLHSLSYFFSPRFLKEVEFKNQWNVKVVRDLDFYISQYILTQEQKEFLLLILSLPLKGMSKFPTSMELTYMDDTYFIRTERNEGLYSKNFQLYLRSNSHPQFTEPVKAAFFFRDQPIIADDKLYHMNEYDEGQNYYSSVIMQNIDNADKKKIIEIKDLHADPEKEYTQRIIRKISLNSDKSQMILLAHSIADEKSYFELFAYCLSTSLLTKVGQYSINNIDIDGVQVMLSPSGKYTALIYLNEIEIIDFFTNKSYSIQKNSKKWVDWTCGFFSSDDKKFIIRQWEESDEKGDEFAKKYLCNTAVFAVEDGRLLYTLPSAGSRFFLVDNYILDKKTDDINDFSYYIIELDTGCFLGFLKSENELSSVVFDKINNALVLSLNHKSHKSNENLFVESYVSLNKILLFKHFLNDKWLTTCQAAVINVILTKQMNEKYEKFPLNEIIATIKNPGQCTKDIACLLKTILYKIVEH